MYNYVFVTIGARRLLICLILLCPLIGYGQTPLSKEVALADSMINLIRTDQTVDYETKVELADSAFQIYGRADELCKQIETRMHQSTYLDNLGRPEAALKRLSWANQAFNKACDSLLLMDVLSNLTNIYLSLEEYERLDSVSQVFFKLWNPKWKDKSSKFSLMSNLAIAHAYRGFIEESTEMFHLVYQEALFHNNGKYIEKSLINLGSIKGMTGDLDSAYYFLNKAMNNARGTGDQDTYMSLLINLANVDMERGKYDEALMWLDSVYTLADTLKNLQYLSYAQRSRSALFEGLSDYEKAMFYLKDYVELNGELLNEERVKAVAEMKEKFESEKKARKIQSLELDQLDASLKTARIANARNRYLYIGIVLLLGGIGVWTRLQYVRKSRSAIQTEKDISEALLLNILPAEVADELKLNGKSEAQHFESATILFSDFKSFTAISEHLSPAELVEELNYCFKAFDQIMMEYNLEKIKTIGDAYMAAGSLPKDNTAKAADVVMAGLEMQKVIINRKAERDAEKLPAFEMRLGINTGPVVAGIVGVKKFQYDIWGDAVNIASRMETSGEVGQVNISQATYDIIKEDIRFAFIPRGKVDAKGKGEMHMYFVALT